MKSLMVAAMAFAAAPVGAQACREGSPSQLSVVAWEAEPATVLTLDGARITLEFQNLSGLPLRMIDATVRFEDVLGRRITAFDAGEDVSVDADGFFSQTEVRASFDMQILRLLEIDHSDVVTTVCTKAIVTREGDVVRFP